MRIAVSFGLFVVVVAGCKAPAEASVLVDLVPPTQQGALRGVQARLTLTDDKGEHPRLRLLDVDDRTDVVGEDVPLPCGLTDCGGSISVDAGDYDVVLVLSALDRCDVRGDVLGYSGSVSVGHWESAFVDLVLDDVFVGAAGVPAALDIAACGRFPEDELDVSVASIPRHCKGGGVGCCAGVSDFEGEQAAFAAGQTTLPYTLPGVDAVADVDAFRLDATEVTYGMLERCVIAGRCLANRPDNPVRARLDTPINRRLPVQGLLPVDAAEVCAFYGRRLPDDAEWDFAAADRDGVRAKYPIDVADDGVIACKETGVAPAAAHQAFGEDCPAAPLPVASFTSSIERGVADLAGNVAEWTLVRGAGNDGDDVDNDGIPDGAVAVVLRGGGVTSFVELLENDLPLVFEVSAPGDRAALVNAAVDVGFRCAIAVDDIAPGDAFPEQECPGGDDVVDPSGGGGDSDVGP